MTPHHLALNVTLLQQLVTNVKAEYNSLAAKHSLPKLAPHVFEDRLKKFHANYRCHAIRTDSEEKRIQLRKRQHLNRLERLESLTQCEQRGIAPDSEDASLLRANIHFGDDMIPSNLQFDDDHVREAIEAKRRMFVEHSPEYRARYGCLLRLIAWSSFIALTSVTRKRQRQEDATQDATQAPNGIDDDSESLG